MKRSIATLSVVAALSAMLGLSACGGGGGGSSSPSPSTPAAVDAPSLVKTDTVVGTGAEAAANHVVGVTYTLWLYNPSAANSKGTQIEGPSQLVRPLSGLIEGWKQGVPGMKVGGKRTLVIPYDGTKTDFKGIRLAGPVTNNFTLTNASIIPGWVQGVPGMKVGGKRTLIVPAVLAYGSTGDGGSVPANSGLVFDVEVNSTN